MGMEIGMSTTEQQPLSIANFAICGCYGVIMPDFKLLINEVVRFIRLVKSYPQASCILNNYYTR